MPRATRIERRLFLATFAPAAALVVPAATLALVALPGCSDGRTAARRTAESTAPPPSDLLPDRHEEGTDVLRDIVVGPDMRPADVFRAAFAERG